jgi:hypothetical protein
MDHSPLTLLIVGIVWVVSIIAGVTLIRGALADHKAVEGSWMHRAAGELRFRLRLAAGAGLLTWVVLGMIWMITNWR